MREKVNITFSVQRSDGEEETNRKTLVRELALEKIFKQAIDNPMGGEFEFDVDTDHGVETFYGFWNSEQHSLDGGEQS